VAKLLANSCGTQIKQDCKRCISASRLVANKMWKWVDGRCPIRAITNAVNIHYWQDARITAAKTSKEYLKAKRDMKVELFKYIADTAEKKI